MEIREDDLSGSAVRALLAHHLADMHTHSPAESVHALDVEGLAHPSVSFWSAWQGDDLAGVGALEDLGGGRAELKSMRVADRFRGTGVGRALLRHIVAAAQDRGFTGVWLETGGSVQFTPALRLYESEGFVRCAPFDDYVEDPHSVFMTRPL